MKRILHNLLFLSVFLTACTKEEKNSLRLVTAGNKENFQQFNINISSVQINLKTTEGKTLWYSLDSKTGIFDFASDSEWLLASKNNLPDGTITTLRMITAEGSYYVKEGFRYDLSGTGTETTVQLNKPVTGGQVDMKLLINLSGSLVQENNRIYKLKPALLVN